MTQPGAATSTIVGRELLNTCSLWGVLHDIPDHLFCDSISPDRARTIHTSEQPTLPDGSGLGPFVQSRFDPIRSESFTISQTTFSVIPSPQIAPERFTHRNSQPSPMAAAWVHSSRVALTQSGTGTVRM